MMYMDARQLAVMMKRTRLLVVGAAVACACTPQHVAPPPQGAPVKSVVVLDVPEREQSYVEAEFKINPELNRAWVETKVTVPGFEDSDSVYSYRTQVDGLSYDDATRTLWYVGDGVKVECGHFNDQVRVGAGVCRFSTKVEPRRVDDGYFVTTKKFRTVSLEIYERR